MSLDKQIKLFDNERFKKVAKERNILINFCDMPPVKCRKDSTSLFLCDGRFKFVSLNRGIVFDSDKVAGRVQMITVELGNGSQNTCEFAFPQD